MSACAAIDTSAAALATTAALFLDALIVASSNPPNVAAPKFSAYQNFRARHDVRDTGPPKRGYDLETRELASGAVHRT